MAGEAAVWVQPKDYKIVGAALAAARDRAGLTQKQLARKLRKPQSLPAALRDGLPLVGPA